MTFRIEPAAPPYSEPIQSRFDSFMPRALPPLVLFRTMARDERLFSRFFGATLLDKGNVSVRERELTILRVCANNRSEYEWGVHVAIFANQASFTPEQLFATRHGSPQDSCWSESDRRLLRLCDTLHASCELPSALWEELRAVYSETAMLELLMLNGLYRMVSLLTVSLQMPLEPWAKPFPAVG